MLPPPPRTEYSFFPISVDAAPESCWLNPIVQAGTADRNQHKLQLIFSPITAHILHTSIIHPFHTQAGDEKQSEEIKAASLATAGPPGLRREVNTTNTSTNHDVWTHLEQTNNPPTLTYPHMRPWLTLRQRGRGLKEDWRYGIMGRKSKFRAKKS